MRSRIVQLTIKRGSAFGNLLEFILDSGRRWTDCYTKGDPLGLPAGYRLAFRELGLSIGLSGAELLAMWINENPSLFGRQDVLQGQVQFLAIYGPLGNTIEQFWMRGTNRQAATWTGHREINMVMLATSLSPRGFLGRITAVPAPVFQELFTLKDQPLSAFPGNRFRRRSTGIERPEKSRFYGIKSRRKKGFMETISFQQIVTHQFYGGDSACPPEPPLRFAIVSYYLLWSYRSRGCHSGGGGGITCRSPQRALRKIF